MTMAAQRVRQIERPRDRGDAPTAPVPTLHKSSPVPLYYQLKRLSSNCWIPGSGVPTRRCPPSGACCEQFHITASVRQALAELVREGRLIRSHGRGTFVAQGAAAQTGLPARQLHAGRARARHAAWRQRCCCSRPPRPPPHVMAALRLGIGDKMIPPEAPPPGERKRWRWKRSTFRAAGARISSKRNLEDVSLTSLTASTASCDAREPAMGGCPAGGGCQAARRSRGAVLGIEQKTFDRNGRPFEHLE